MSDEIDEESADKESLDKFAFPQGVYSDILNESVGPMNYGGMTKHELAAILLRVPMADKDWLNEMIYRARRLDLIKAAMQALLTNANMEIWTDEYLAEQAIKYVDAILSTDQYNNYKKKTRK